MDSPRPRRWLPLALLSLAAAALLVAFVSIALNEGDDRPIRIEGVGEVIRLFSGIPQEGQNLGDPDAPVTLSVFNDLQCEPCGDWQIETTPPLVEDLVRDGGTRIRFRTFSTGMRRFGESFFAAAAAGRQGREWQYAYLFFLNQEEAATRGQSADEFDTFLLAVAQAVPQLDVPEWQRDIGSERVRRLVEIDAVTARELRLPAQPAVTVNGPGGDETLVESPSVAEIMAAVRKVGP